MLAVFVIGIRASRGPNSGFNDFNKEYPGYTTKGALTALVYIFESYQGWDNANYVSRIHPYQGRSRLFLTWAGLGRSE
jgi:hypothetical protein